APPADQFQPQQIDHARTERRTGAGEPSCEGHDNRRSAPGGSQGDEMAGDERIAGQHLAGGIDQEQPDRLAIPDIDIGKG
nr:hypothetical protein [Tanacetum cinerariifolium]